MSVVIDAVVPIAGAPLALASRRFFPRHVKLGFILIDVQPGGWVKAKNVGYAVLDLRPPPSLSTDR